MPKGATWTIALTLALSLAAPPLQAQAPKKAKKPGVAARQKQQGAGKKQPGAAALQNTIYFRGQKHVIAIGR